jgi:hypothetical protein
MSASDHTTHHRSFSKIRAASARVGIGRSSLYELAAKHRGLFRKFGSATLVDDEILDSIVNKWPAARIGAARGRKVLKQRGQEACDV